MNKNKPRRTILFHIFFWWAVLLAISISLNLFVEPLKLVSGPAVLATWFTLFKGFKGVFQLFCLYLVWKWKKAGIYGLAVIILFNAVIQGIELVNSIINASISGSAIGWVIAIIFWGLLFNYFVYWCVIKPIWKYFEDDQLSTKFLSKFDFDRNHK